jgi:hypothetical protein
LIETAFDGGGDLTTSSAEEVLRALMRLREDQKRQALF